MLIGPTRAPQNVNHFVTTTGGDYFFSPSISTVQGLGDGAIWRFLSELALCFLSPIPLAFGILELSRLVVA